MRSTTLNGTVVHICTFLNGAPLSAHKANRYEYDLNVEACTPVDRFSTCDVNALALSSVAGPASSVALSGPLFDILFGARPDVRKGASDLAAVAYSHHAVDVRTGEVDPGVGLGVRAGDFSAAPLSGTIVFGGTITGDKNYTAFSKSGVLSDPNAKLSLAMGGSTGGRAFSLAKPYVNRAPISQQGREALAVNADTATILKGNTLAWSGRAVRLMTPADSLDLLAGVALNDSVAGERTRFLRSGFVGEAYLLFSGSPTFAIGDLFGVAGAVGRIAKSAAHAMLRVRSLATYGSVFEILEDRFDSSVIEASPASAANFSASDA